MVICAPKGHGMGLFCAEKPLPERAIVVSSMTVAERECLDSALSLLGFRIEPEE